MLQEIDSTDPINSTFEFYEEVPDVDSLYISGSDVNMVERYFGGDGVPRGADAKALNNWCIQFYSESEHLWKELYHWAEWIANKHLPWEAI